MRRPKEEAWIMAIPVMEFQAHGYKAFKPKAE